MAISSEYVDVAGNAMGALTDEIFETSRDVMLVIDTRRPHLLLILANVAMAPIGGLLALLITNTHFSVSSGVGFLALAIGVKRQKKTSQVS